MSDSFNFILIISSLLIEALLFRSLFDMNGAGWKWWSKLVLFFAVGIASVTYCIFFIHA